MKFLKATIISIILTFYCAKPTPAPPPPPPPVIYKVLILIDVRSNENFRPIEGVNVDIHVLDKDWRKVKSLFLQTDATGTVQATVRLYEKRDPHRANISVHAPGFRGFFDTVDIYSIDKIIKRIIYLIPEK